MSNNKTAFAKRQRETDRKDKARAKEARLAAQRANATKGGGPPIDWSAMAPAVEETAETDTDGADTDAPPTDAPRDPAE